MLGPGQRPASGVELEEQDVRESFIMRLLDALRDVRVFQQLEAIISQCQQELYAQVMELDKALATVQLQLQIREESLVELRTENAQLKQRVYNLEKTQKAQAQPVIVTEKPRGKELKGSPIIYSDDNKVMEPTNRW